ncbi:hypothetical protein ABGV42_01230 [Paenibacillus pabuli]
MFTVMIKSGTSGYFEQDDIDLKIADIDSNNIPNKGDILELPSNDSQSIQSYIVHEVRRKYVKGVTVNFYNEFFYVYVYKI